MNKEYVSIGEILEMCKDAGKPVSRRRVYDLIIESIDKLTKQAEKGPMPSRSTIHFPGAQKIGHLWVVPTDEAVAWVEGRENWRKKHGYCNEQVDIQANEVQND